MKPANLRNPPKAKPRHKYKSHPRRVDGIWFGSTLEANKYVHLKMQQAAGVISHFHRQVIFDLAGATYKCDFLIFYPDGSYRYIDVKGFKTKAFKRNMKQIEQIYPMVKVEAVK